jgi:type I restriction enzyme M protein
VKSARDVLDRLFAAGVGEPVFALEQVSLLVLLKWLSLPGTGEVLWSPAGPPTEARNAARVWKQLKRRTGNSELQSFAAGEASDELREAARLFGLEFTAAMRDVRIDLSNHEVLADVIRMLDASFPDHPGAYGDLFDELLTSAELSGRQGQLVTPRPLVDAMVAATQPGPSDRVLDPAAGTAGFLVAARNRAMSKYATTPLIGYGSGLDLDAAMVRIGAVNLLLHGDSRPQMHHWDGLREGLPGDERADDFKGRARGVRTPGRTVVLSNPPFTATLDPAESASGWLDLSGARPDLLFVDVCRRRIGRAGRGAIVVPVAALFGSSPSHEAVRARLLDSARIVAVAGLPPDTFPPHAEVQAAVMLFDGAGPTQRVWFTDLHDGPDGLVEAREALVSAQPLDPPAGWWSAEADEIRTSGGTLLPAAYAAGRTATTDDPLKILAEIVGIEDELRERLAKLGGMLKQ